MMKNRHIMLLLMLVGTLSLSAQGMRLFSPAVHDAVGYHQRVVMDFLERYFGKDLTTERHTSLVNKMADDKVYFRKGKLSDMALVSDTMPFSITLNDRYYEVQWMQHEEPFITIVFPAQYGLLLGMQQNEAQQKLKESILAAPMRIDTFEVPSDLQITEDSIYVSKKEKFELESLNDAIYYNKVGDNYQPVFDNMLQEYSAANLFHGLINGADYRMYVEQSVYGMKTINYTLTLSQWLNYCAELGMKVFFAVEEQREDGLLTIVLTQCKELGFNHLLSVVIPDKFVDDKNAVLKVRLTPYIPTHNVKDLYKKETQNRKKVVWQ